MATIDIQEISPQLAELLQNLAAGETIIITRANQPLAEVKTLQSESRSLRPWGLAKGQFRVPDDFNDPLPEELLETFAPRIAGLHSGEAWISDDFDAPLDVTPQD
ncbi:MAG TPA: hypothetical protein VGE07_18705 [Herpetosiphonaceae bacterium]